MARRRPHLLEPTAVLERKLKRAQQRAVAAEGAVADARSVGCRIAIERLREVTDVQAHAALHVLLGEDWYGDLERRCKDLARETTAELVEDMRRAVAAAVLSGVDGIELPGALGYEGSTLNEIGVVLVGHGFDPAGEDDPAAWLRKYLHELVEQRDEARAAARVLAHAYEHDSRPPARVVAEAAAFPPTAPGRIGAPP